MKTISLVKGEERYIFRYKSGQEEEMIDTFAEYASNPELNFDWFNAALLSYQMGRRMHERLEEKV